MQNHTRKPPYFSIRFADGTKMWLNNDSPTELLLNPAFLKFLGICILIVAMLDRNSLDFGMMKAQQVALLWPILGIQAMIWFALVFFAVNALYERRGLTSIYTPLIVVPQVLLIQVTMYIVAYSLNPSGAKEIAFPMGEMLRDVVLMIAFDILFSSYVVHQHPFFSKEPVVLLPSKKPQYPLAKNAVEDPTHVQDAQADLAARPIVPSPPAPPPAPAPIEVAMAPPAPEIQLGSKAFAADAIEMIRAEDHYLAIFTPNRKDLVRARMSESVTKLDIRYGVQVNRSTWVAFSIIDKLSTTGKRVEVHLTNGNIEPVASVRRHAVESAYRLHLRQKDEG